MDREKFKLSCKGIKLVQLINKYFPSDIEGIISFGLVYKSNYDNPVMLVDYYDEKGKIKTYQFEIEEGDY